MTRFSLPNRRVIIITVGILLLVILLFNPRHSRLGGSTYSRTPDGYGAWYAYMQAKGAPINRWLKPPEQLPESGVLIQVDPSLGRSLESPQVRNPDVRAWVGQGNTLVVLGRPVDVTEAPFRTIHKTSMGEVEIETSRRKKISAETSLLKDPYGSIVWQEPIGKGRILYSATPFLAANAYQDASGNFRQLAEWISTTDQPLWVDEYMHGYRDPEDPLTRASGNWAEYLWRTPLSVVAVQLVLIALVAIWALNRPFGQARRPDPPITSNTAAYIQALAGVLQKAESNDFVVEVLGKSERIRIQQALGLGRQPMDTPTLLQAWVAQTGHPAESLAVVLRQIPVRPQPSQGKSHTQTKVLKTWLQQVQWIRDHLPDPS